MRLATLVTNTDRSDFAARHPWDGEKFAAMIHSVRPDWTVEAFDATEGDLPDPLDHDGYMVTGSPASVNGDAGWIGPLLETLRQIVAEGRPLFGACFGHQAIAKALGGEVGANPGPFVLGPVTAEMARPLPWMAAAQDTVRLCAAHGEQVTRLPEGAEVVAHGPGCEIAGFVMGRSIFTTTYHPEMSPEFIAALIEAYADQFSPDVVERARESLAEPAQNTLFAEWIARFFEQGVHRA